MRIFTLSKSQIVDFIYLWGESISNNEDKQITNNITFGNIAKELNMKYNTDKFNSAQLIKKSGRMRRSYIEVSILCLLYI